MGWTKLKSVNCLIDDRTGRLYPGGDPGETTKSFHINDVDPKWWDDVSEEDRVRLREVATMMEMRENMERWK